MATCEGFEDNWNIIFIVCSIEYCCSYVSTVNVLFDSNCILHVTYLPNGGQPLFVPVEIKEKNKNEIMLQDNIHIMIIWCLC